MVRSTRRRSNSPSAVPASDRRSDGFARLKRGLLLGRALYYRLRGEPTPIRAGFDEPDSLKRELVAGMERCILDAQKRGKDLPRELILEWMRLRGELGDAVEAAPRSSAATPRRTAARKSVQGR